MKRPVGIILVIAFLLASCGKDRISIDDGQGGIAPGSGPRYIFDDTRVPTLSIYVGEDQWNNLLELYDQDSHNHTYVSCYSVTLERDDATLRSENAGLRLRGQTSRRRPEGKSGQRHSATNPKWHHVHFGLHLRKFSEDGNLAGVRRINLKYAKEDPSYIREHFCFEMLRDYGVWTAPLTSWCRLLLQVGNTPPANFGVYLMMESIDRQYVRQRAEFGPEWGYLWKCAWGANLRDADDWRFHLDDDSSDTYAYELKSDSADDFAPAKALLKDFIRNLNSLKGADFYNWIQAHCDVDLLLRMYAANVALGHWDDYWNDMNNFYLYFNSRDAETYKVYMLPYDYDNTMGTSHNCGVQNDSGRHNPYRWGLDECVLISKILEVADFRNIYTGYLRELSDENNPYTGILQSASRIRQWQSALKPYVANDTGEEMEIKDRPASWGNHPEYRLLEDGSNNWFRVKAASIRSYLP